MLMTPNFHIYSKRCIDVQRNEEAVAVTEAPPPPERGTFPPDLSYPYITNGGNLGGITRERKRRKEKEEEGACSQKKEFPS